MLYIILFSLLVSILYGIRCYNHYKRKYVIHIDYLFIVPFINIAAILLLIAMFSISGMIDFFDDIKEDKKC